MLAVSRRGDQLVITNRKARHDYLILDSWECGIMLAGPEVKSVREGRANLQDGYARVEDGEVWLYGMHVSPYSYSRVELDPVRKRKLLLHRKEITALERGTAEKGHTLVPLRVYFKNGRAKVELALARGKRAYDKRQALARARRQTGSRAGHEGHPRVTLPRAPAPPVPWRGRAHRHAPVRHLTWGCVASISDDRGGGSEPTSPERRERAGTNNKCEQQ